MRAYEELDHCDTALGALVLRRRRMPTAEATEVWEVLIDGAFLMSSLVHASEDALAVEGLRAAGEGPHHVLVGGLGLGYTAREALRVPAVERVAVLELLPAVIGWHERDLVPAARALTGDSRCSLVERDFFRFVLDTDGPLRVGDSPPIDVVLLDVDHSPRALLTPAHGALYEPEGLAHLAERLPPGGVFALWSADVEEEAFTERLGTAFGAAHAMAVEFYNPHVHADEINTVYVATRSI